MIKFVCNKCHKSYSSKNALNNHLRTSNSCSDKKKEYVCDKCGKEFHRNFNLQQHKSRCNKKTDIDELKEKMIELEKKIKLMETNNTINSNNTITYNIQNNITSDDIIKIAKELSVEDVEKPKDILGHFFKGLKLADKININENGEAYYYFNGKLITESQDFEYLISQIIYYSRDDMGDRMKESIMDNLFNIGDVMINEKDVVDNIKCKEDLNITNLTIIRNNIDTNNIDNINKGSKSYQKLIDRSISLESKKYDVIEQQLKEEKNECFKKYKINIK